MKIERNKILEFLNDNETFHSNFQIDNFIICGSSSTVYGKYKQSIREVSSRYDTLKNHYLDREVKTLDLKILELDLKELNDVSEKGKILRRKKEIEIIRANSELEKLDLIIFDTEREFARIYGHCEILKNKLGTLDNKKKAILEEEYWVERIKTMAILELISSGQVQGTTLDMLSLISSEKREKILESLDKEHINDSIKWFYDKSSSFENDIKKLDTNIENLVEIKKLVSIGESV